MFWLYAGENALTVVAALALYPVAGVKGLAGAWIGSYTVALPFAWHRLRKSAPITWSAGWLTPRFSGYRCYGRGRATGFWQSSPNDTRLGCRPGVSSSSPWPAPPCTWSWPGPLGSKS